MKDHSKEIRDIARRYGLKLVVLFGSRARGDETPDSDYDIGLYGRQVLKEEELIALQREFSRLFRTDAIDLVDIKRASPLLKVKVFEAFEVLYEDDPFLKHQLPLSAEAEFEECRDLYEMRADRLREFVSED
jgi:predicted nucleotidyltransferase